MLSARYAGFKGEGPLENWKEGNIEVLISESMAKFETWSSDLFYYQKRKPVIMQLAQETSALKKFNLSYLRIGILIPHKVKTL